MGDKTATETVQVNIPRSVASPGPKDRKKTATDTPGKLTTAVLQRAPRDLPRRGSAVQRGQGPITRKDEQSDEFSHKPGHRRRRKQTPAQRRASMANLKKARATRGG